MEEILFWNKLNVAYASFCVSTLQTSKSDQQELISTIVGEELEWCKYEALVSMTANHSLLQQRSQEVENTLKETDRQLMYERETSSSLRKQIKMLQLSAEDTAWELQEQLAHATNTLQVERDGANEVKEQLEATQAKLTEVELYLTSERGTVTLQLEEELAAAKLRCAELEAEKDDLEIELRRRSKQRGNDGNGASSNGNKSFGSDHRINGNSRDSERDFSSPSKGNSKIRQSRVSGGAFNISKGEKEKENQVQLR